MVTTGMTIQPAYDPAAGVWFVEGRDEEAKTIRDLLTKFPEGCRVQDYYPGGCMVRWESDRPYGTALTIEPPKINIPRVVDFKPSPKQQVSVLKKSTPDEWPTMTASVLAPSGRKKPPWTPEQYEQALDMWAAGVGGKVIAEKVGLPRVVVSSRMIESARIKKDPRAISRRNPYARTYRGDDV